MIILLQLICKICKIPVIRLAAQLYSRNVQQV